MMRISFKNTLVGLFSIASLMVTANLHAAEDLYIWTDAKGVTHISTQAPKVNEVKSQQPVTVVQGEPSKPASDINQTSAQGETSVGFSKKEATEPPVTTLDQQISTLLGKEVPPETKEDSSNATLREKVEKKIQDVMVPKSLQVPSEPAQANTTQNESVKAEIQKLQEEMQTLKKRARIAKANNDKSKLAHLRHQSIKLTNRLKELQQMQGNP